MRVRAMDADSDMKFGHSQSDYLVDSPDMVRQNVLTRLRLLQGEWFLNSADGTPWFQEILDKGTNQTYDLAIQTRVLETVGVDGIIAYDSNFDSVERKLSVSMRIQTVFSQEAVTVNVVI